MKTVILIGVSLFLCGLISSPSFAVEIISITVAAPSTMNLCRSLGGQDVDPVITITHAKKAGDRIMVRMYDVISNGGVVEHRTKSVISEVDGSTRLVAAFIAPCNRTQGRVNSFYRFDVTSKGSAKKTVSWFKFDSGSKKINPQ